MLATIVCVLLIGVETGILVGVSLSLLLFLWRTSQPHVAIVGLVPGTEHFRNVDRYDVITHPSVLTLRIDESLYFANAGYLEDKIYEQVAAKPEVKHVILMCSAVNMIDASALESLSAISHRLNSSEVSFHLSEVKGPVMDSLQRSDFFEHFKGKVFLSQFEAIKVLTPE
jgi:SulP family sulfate permease